MAKQTEGTNPIIPAARRPTAAVQLERYRLLVDSVQDYAIFLLDSEGYVSTWNAGARRFKGYEEHEIVGKHFTIFYTPEDLAIAKPARELKEAIETGRAEDEGWRVRKDGSRFWANVVITALFDTTGQHIGFAKVTRDLSERKAMEDELARTNAELLHRQDELTRLNQAKDEFISLASHQLRTPATGVKQYLNLILQGFLGDVPPAIMAALRKANDGNDRQLELVNDLLKVAQLDAGKVSLKTEPTDMTALLRDVLAEQKESIRVRHQKISLQAPAEPVIATIDSHRLRMVLENLLDNASKYTPDKGNITLSVAVVNRELRVCVKDDGVGIHKQDIAKLFTKFTRLKNDLSDKVGGSGLGLYWAERVVQLHGGRIEVVSKSGKGTEFIVCIPREAGRA